METVMSEMFGQTLIGKPSSEFRFDELKNKQQAISEFISQTKKFIVRNSLKFEDFKRDVFRIKLPSGSIFKYDDQLPSFLRAIEKGERSTVVVVQRNGDIVVHPALSWVEIQSTAVEQYSRFEVFDVAIASRSSLDRHDLTVDPFSHCIGDPVGTVGHNVIDSLLQTPS
jgi:hypothetical protein